jgi:hypothetical protein
MLAVLKDKPSLIYRKPALPSLSPAPGREEMEAFSDQLRSELWGVLPDEMA